MVFSANKASLAGLRNLHRRLLGVGFLVEKGPRGAHFRTERIWASGVSTVGKLGGCRPHRRSEESPMADPLYRILVVDDEPVVRELTILALQREGFRCEPAVDGTQAIQMVEATRFDAVITDLRMPGVNGHALAVKLLSLEDRPVVVVVTGVSEPKLARDLLARGVDDIFFKPVNHRLLAIKLGALLDQQKANACRCG
jgi:CheY-like chemotaxis protein